jgi:hypothetical protein
VPANHGSRLSCQIASGGRRRPGRDLVEAQPRAAPIKRVDLVPGSVARVPGSTSSRGATTARASLSHCPHAKSTEAESCGLGEVWNGFYHLVPFSSQTRSPISFAHTSPPGRCRHPRLSTTAPTHTAHILPLTAHRSFSSVFTSAYLVVRVQFSESCCGCRGWKRLGPAG